MILDWGGMAMAQQDQDIENRLKCLKSTELTELLDFIIPNRSADSFDDGELRDLPTNGVPRPH